jgi:putative transposase
MNGQVDVGIAHPTFSSIHFYPMSQYRRFYVPGSTVFLTVVTYQRIPLFENPENVQCLRRSLKTVQASMPFEFLAGVVMPEHLHFLWTMPEGDSNYSKRIGRMKVLFTQALRGEDYVPEAISRSRQKHRESDVWQRRFWEHTIRDERDFQNHCDYLHANPVKHGLAQCPHEWELSSFHRWVQQGKYSADWGCRCGNRISRSSITKDQIQP